MCTSPTCKVDSTLHFQTPAIGTKTQVTHLQGSFNCFIRNAMQTGTKKTEGKGEKKKKTWDCFENSSLV
jgi:hypothetical protein